MEFLSINTKSGDDPEDQAKILEKCSIPFFQDTWDLDVWSMHDGGKDDMYIYGKDGLLRTFLPAQGDISTNLRTDTGYSNLKNAILAVVNEATP